MFLDFLIFIVLCLRTRARAHTTIHFHFSYSGKEKETNQKNQINETKKCYLNASIKLQQSFTQYFMTYIFNVGWK